MIKMQKIIQDIIIEVYRNKKGLEIEYKDNTKKSTPYYPISNAKKAINFLIEK